MDDVAMRLDEWSPRLLKSRLYQRILVDIIIGRLEPGEQLDENNLARRYGGGLAGIREALARLALEGLVMRRARVGTSVAPLDMIGAREAFEARCLIELHCAGLAAQHASEAEIAGIRATLADGEQAVAENDAAALAAMDEAFHVAVASASHNRTLAKMVVTLHHQTARYWLYARKEPVIADPQDGLAALNEHRALAEAIAGRNPDKARAAMLTVLGDFPAEMKRSLEGR
ncbi:MAG TPA: GntR family transcriptional regulator [Rhizomicrobium sp.]|jgi:DNA-binding GntR family transcriptional regulator|nr:GntR family transcriptional regulator [Rhizomicrobium sp.]